jgi:hemoglobin
LTELSESQVYDVVGKDGFVRLVSAFYRQVPDDDILGPMYPPADLDGAEARLRGFLIGRFGGPQTYIEERGHPKLRMRHMFPLTPAARDRWVALMENALNETAFPEPVDALLRGFFAQTATFLINHP